MTRPLILASASPRRRDLLERHGFAFEVRAADVDETPPTGEAPPRVAELLALKKARAVAVGVERGTVIGADTIVVGGEDVLLGKPEDADDARRILASLSGTTHRVITGVAVIHRPEDDEQVAHEVTYVTMRAMTADEIGDYVDSGESFGKAGAYAIQETGDRFVTKLEGDYENVVGLPVGRLKSMLDADDRAIRTERSES